MGPAERFIECFEKLCTHSNLQAFREVMLKLFLHVTYGRSLVKGWKLLLEIFENSCIDPIFSKSIVAEKYVECQAKLNLFCSKKSNERKDS